MSLTALQKPAQSSTAPMHQTLRGQHIVSRPLDRASQCGCGVPIARHVMAGNLLMTCAEAAVAELVEHSQIGTRHAA